MEFLEVMESHGIFFGLEKVMENQNFWEKSWNFAHGNILFSLFIFLFFRLDNLVSLANSFSYRIEYVQCYYRQFH